MRTGTLISGLVLVLTGVVFFLVNLGYGTWADIYVIGRFWPILLIIFGLGFFFRGTIPRVIAWLILILSVGAVSAYLLQAELVPQNHETISKSALTVSRQQYPQVKEADLKINFGGGKLTFSPAAQELFKADFNSTQVEREIQASGQNLRIDLNQHQTSWSPREDHLNIWQLQLSPDLSWKLDMNTGAVDGNIDLRGVPFHELDCNLGAGNMLFMLGGNGSSSKLAIEAGASNVKLRFAPDTGVKINLNGELNASNLHKLGWTSSGDSFISPNYEQARCKIDCDINLSVGNLDVDMQ